MGRRTPQSAAKRAREQGLREKRELKQAKKDARRRQAEDGLLPDAPELEGESDLSSEEESDGPADGEPEPSTDDA